MKVSYVYYNRYQVYRFRKIKCTKIIYNKNPKQSLYRDINCAYRSRITYIVMPSLVCLCV